MQFKKIQIPIIFIILLSAISLISVVALIYFFPKDKKLVPDMKSSNSNYVYINPLLDCADTQLDPFNYGGLADDIKELVNKNTKSGNIKSASIYFRDLSNGPWFGYNEEERFSPASLMKVPLLIAYLKMSESDQSLLDKKVNTGDLSSLISQNILPDKTVKANTEYTIKELLEYMIRYSDNFAAEALLKNVDPVNLDNIYMDLSLKIPNWGNTENYMTVRDYSSFFRILYNSSYLNRENSELALSILSESVFKEGLVAGLPKNTQISHKFGERVLEDAKQLHDCGIIYGKKGDYLICIMTRGQDFEKMKVFLRDTSSLVYSNFYE